jgi:chromosome segregation ATPase
MKGMSTSPSSSTLPSDRTDILSRCKDTIEMLNETLEEERNHSQQIAERLRNTEEELIQLREEQTVLKNRHRAEMDRFIQQQQDREAKFTMLKEKLASLVAANTELLDRNKLLEEQCTKKDALASDWGNTIAKLESDTQTLLEENAKLLSEREDIRIMVQLAFNAQMSQQPAWSNQASATSMALVGPAGREVRDQNLLAQIREERLTQSVAGGPNTDESRASMLGNIGMVDKISAILRSAAAAFEENDKLRSELDGLHSLMEEHAGVMEGAQNEKQRMQSEFTEQLNHMCHTIHELHKDIESLTSDKRDLEEVAEKMREQLEEESINNERLQRRLRILREDKDDQLLNSREVYGKATARGAIGQNPTTATINSGQTDKTSAKLIEILEKQLDERNQDLADIRDRVKELEGVYRTELAGILMQSMQPPRGCSSESLQVLGERRANTENTPTQTQHTQQTQQQQTGRGVRVSQSTQKEPKQQQQTQGEQEQLLGRFRQVVGSADCR